MAQKAMPLKAILSYPNKTISQLCLQVNHQLAMLQHIKTVLPTDLADHALHCVLNKKKLLIYTDSAIWASQLRFYGKTILSAIEFATPMPIPLLQVKIINLPTTANINQKSVAVTPSQTVVDEIRSHSLIITDPQLKKALDKLSSTLARLQGGNS
jgi:hypothetical protein